MLLEQLNKDIVKYNNCIEIACHSKFRETLEQALRIRCKSMENVIVAMYGEWNDAHHRNLIKNKLDKYFYFIIQLDVIIGNIRIVENTTDLELTNFQILPEYSNTGIGSLILNCLINIANELRKDIKLQVLTKNINAIKLYSKYGFDISHITNEFVYMKYVANKKVVKYS